MNGWQWLRALAVGAVIGSVIAGAIVLKTKPALRDTFVLRFAVCTHELDLSFKCEPCFAGEREPLCPADARVMMMRPK